MAHSVLNTNLGNKVSTCSNRRGSLTRIGARSDLVGRDIAFTNFFAFSTLDQTFVKTSNAHGNQMKYFTMTIINVR